MTPDQSGNIGEQFLRHFLIMLAERCGQKLENPTEIINYEFKKVTVRREHKCVGLSECIDLLVEIEIKSKHEKILLVIENKVYAKEQKGQLLKYRKAIVKEYEGKGYYPHFLFLTPNKRKPKEDAEVWLPIGYKLIDKVLYRLDLDTADNTIKILIKDYRKMIRSEFGMDNNGLEHQEAIKLYAKYREAFDFVFECKNKQDKYRVKKTAQVIRDFLGKREQKEWIEVMTTENANRFIKFTTTSINNLWQDKSKIYFLIDVWEMSLTCYVDNSTQEERDLLEYSDRGSNFQYPKQWLFDQNTDKPNNKINEERVKELDKHVLNDINKLKAECEQMLDYWFGGWIKSTSDDICRKLKGVSNSDS